MKPAELVTETWSYTPNSGTERIEYDLLNLCFQALGGCLIRSGTRTTELCGASLSLKVSGAVHLVTVGQRSLKGVSVDFPRNGSRDLISRSCHERRVWGLRTPELVSIGYRLYQETLRCDDLSPIVIEALVLELLVALVRQNRRKNRSRLVG
jgi:hypothetical protein